MGSGNIIDFPTPYCIINSDNYIVKNYLKKFKI